MASDDFRPYDVAHMKRKDLLSQRKQREFIPDNKKDDSYWDRRRRNNEAAKRSREKRRYNDMVLETRVIELSKENHVLKAQLDAIKAKYNISGENLVSVDQIMATLPTTEQILSITKRIKPNHADSVSPSPSENVLMNSNRYDSNMNGGSPTQINLNSSNKSVLNNGNNNNGFVVSGLAPPSIPLTPQPQAQPQQYHQSHIIFRQSQISPFDHQDHDMEDSKEYRQIPQQNHAPVLHQPQTNGFKPLPTSPPVQLQPQIPPHAEQQIQQQHVYCPEPVIMSHQSQTIKATKSYSPIHEDVTPPQPITNGSHFMSNGRIVTAAAKKALPFQHQPNYHSHLTHRQMEADSVLNLSRRSGSVGDAASTGSASDNGHDDRDSDPYPHSDYYNDINGNHGESHSDRGSSLSCDDPDHDLDLPSAVSIAHREAHSLNDQNNSLPLKLRHKSHFMGDKDAATTLLALHNIKQEPNLCPAVTSNESDGENSMDDRDSGIGGATTANLSGRIIVSNGNQEWAIQKKILVNTGNHPQIISNFQQLNHLNTTLNLLAHHEKEDQDGNVNLKSELPRLDAEIVTIKNMMIMNTNGGASTAAAQ